MRSNMICKILIFSLIFIMVKGESRETQQVDESKDDDLCICTAIYAPVCASDGKTYSSSCVLGCTRKKNPYVFGLCKGECPCCKEPFFNEPIFSHEEIGFWGWNRISDAPLQVPIANPQKRIEDKTELMNKEEEDSCSQIYSSDCFCTQIADPVCGSDGRTYGNPCELGCQQKVKPCLKQACAGQCPCCACSSTNYTTSRNAKI